MHAQLHSSSTESSLSIKEVGSENCRNHSDRPWCNSARFWRDYLYNKGKSNRLGTNRGNCKKGKDDSPPSYIRSHFTDWRDCSAGYIRKTSNLAHHSKAGNSPARDYFEPPSLEVRINLPPGSIHFWTTAEMPIH